MKLRAKKDKERGKSMEETASRQDKKALGLGLLLLGLYGLAWACALGQAPSDAHQGEVYRILYVHVPCALTAFAAAAGLLLCSLLGLRGHRHAVRWGRASAEVGLLFTLITLATGSIWGKPTWGVWWTWDARLTTTFILALLYAGYLLCYSALASGALRTKVCSVLGLVIFADIPIIYKSVTWWRTLHQPPSLLRAGGPAMAAEFMQVLAVCIALTLALAAWMLWQRAFNLELQEEVEALSFQQLSQQEF